MWTEEWLHQEKYVEQPTKHYDDPFAEDSLQPRHIYEHEDSYEVAISIWAQHVAVYAGRNLTEGVCRNLIYEEIVLEWRGNEEIQRKGTT